MNPRRSTLLVLCAWLSISADICHALPGDLDATYAAPPAGTSGVAFSLSQPDGKLIVSYEGSNLLVRYDSGGAVDAGFQSPFEAGESVRAAALQSSGTIVVASELDGGQGFPVSVIIRLNPDGSVDGSFEIDPELDGPILPSVSTLRDDRLLIQYGAGELILFGRLLPDGAHDPTFNDYGIFGFEFLLSPTIPPDGSIYTISSGQITKLQENGDLDETFDDTRHIARPRSLLAQPDGKLLIGGASLGRVDEYGVPDPGFDLDGTFGDPSDQSIHQMSRDTSGRIVVSGELDSYGGMAVAPLLRFMPDGRRDYAFDASGVIGAGTSVIDHQLMPDGKICVAVEHENGAVEIVRLAGGDPPPTTPSIATQPTSQIGLQHRAVTFEVIAHGFPVPEYQWRKDGADIPGEQNRKLEITPLDFADAGLYSVLISNSAGSVASDDAGLTVVLPRPGQLDYSFVPQLSSGTVRQLEIVDGGKILLGGHYLPQVGGNGGRLLRLNPDGSTDASFADPISDSFFTANSMAVQPDGKILTGGTFVYVERREANGAVDSSFTISRDICCEEPDARNLALQSDGKIIVYGRTSGFFGAVQREGLVRLLPSGQLDASFPQTLYQGPIYTAPDDKIFAQGSNNFSTGLVRLLPDGSDDPSFGADISDYNHLRAIVEQPDGKVLALFLGNLIRLNVDGTLDDTFSAELDGLDSSIQAMALEPSGKILIGGSFRNIGGIARTTIARLYPDGMIDLSFEPEPGLGGRIDQIRVQPDGQIVIAGDFDEFGGQPRHGVARLQGGEQTPQAPVVEVAPVGGRLAPGEEFQLSVLTTIHPRPSYQWRLDGRDIIGATGRMLDLERVGIADAGEYTVVITNDLGTLETAPVSLAVPFTGFATGEVDLTFDAGELRHPTLDAQVSSIWARTDEDILIAGRFQTVGGIPRENLARLSGVGVVDASFPEATTARLTTILPQPDDSFFIAGDLKFERRLADGSLDPNWVENGSGIVGEVRVLAQQPDGKLIVAGDLDEYDLTQVADLIRVNSDRSLDETFTLSEGALEGVLDDEIDALALLPDGKLLVGGEFGLVRLMNDGQVDETYTVDLGLAGVEAILLLEDGSTFIGGDFTLAGGIVARRIALLDADGVLDPSFETDVTLDGQVKALALQPDGKILVAGENLSRGGVPLGEVLRFLRSGKLDRDLLIELEGGDEEIRTLALQDDGRLLIGGEFFTLNGVPRENVARVFIEPTPALSYVDGEARYLIPSVTGRDYTLQRSSDLADWVEIDTAAGDGSLLILRDDVPEDAGRVYYRIVITRYDLNE